MARLKQKDFTEMSDENIRLYWNTEDVKYLPPKVQNVIELDKEERMFDITFRIFALLKREIIRRFLLE